MIAQASFKGGSGRAGVARRGGRGRAVPAAAYRSDAWPLRHQARLSSRPRTAPSFGRGRRRRSPRFSRVRSENGALRFEPFGAGSNVTGALAEEATIVLSLENLNFDRRPRSRVACGDRRSRRQRRRAGGVARGRGSDAGSLPAVAARLDGRRVGRDTRDRHLFRLLRWHRAARLWSHAGAPKRRDRRCACTRPASRWSRSRHARVRIGGELRRRHAV